MNNHYQLYIEAVITLAETIVVKFDDAAQALNYQVQNAYGVSSVDEFDKASWKYYQNISGRYHFSDKMIQVVSLDTGETIDFTTDNLLIHLATANAYAFGNRQYKELVSNHPGQELLILGILNPTPIDKAINAIDGTILQYPPELVESNERSFVSKLQNWIYQYLDRWVNTQYAISDDLYVASFIMQLYLHMVPAIMNFRLEACKTPEAHSFHVRQYLASHGGLDVYVDQMTRSQALFFYRNILYIQRHAGKRDTFDWLVENVMSARTLPLYEYTMAHNVKDMGRLDVEDDDRLLPAIEFKRKGINIFYTDTDIKTNSMDKVIEKVNPLALGNPQYNLDHEDDMRDAFAHSRSSVSVTKMLESEVIDYSDAAVYTLANILLNHWLGLVGQGRYIANVVVQLPVTGDAIQLTAEHAVALYIYAVHRSCDPEVDHVDYDPLVFVPPYQVNRMTRTVLPPMSELLSITERKTLSVAEVQEIYDTAVEVPFIVSIEAFYQFARKVFSTMEYQHYLYSSKEDFTARGDAKLAVSRLYNDDVFTLESLRDPLNPLRGMRYSVLFAQLGLDVNNYDRTDFYRLAASIVSAATGVASRPTDSLEQLQKAMVSLFAKLSSYSIQVITEINASNIIAVENAAIRVGAGHAIVKEAFHVYVDSSPIKVLDTAFTETQDYQIPIARIAEPEPFHFSESWKHSLDITSRIRMQTGFHPVLPYQIDTGVAIRSSFDFEESVKNLTIEQRTDLVDMYSDYMESVIEPITRTISGFTNISNRKELPGTLWATARRELPHGAFEYTRPTKTLPGISLYSFKRQLPGFDWPDPLPGEVEP